MISITQLVSRNRLNDPVFSETNQLTLRKNAMYFGLRWERKNNNKRALKLRMNENCFWCNTYFVASSWLRQRPATKWVLIKSKKIKTRKILKVLSFKHIHIHTHTQRNSLFRTNLTNQTTSSIVFHCFLVF